MNFKYSKDLYNTDSATVIIPILLEQFSIQSALDVGCGIGSWLSVLEKNGVTKLMGVDGPHAISSFTLNSANFRDCNLNAGFDFQQKFDLAICLEVAEHLEISSANIIVESLIKHSDLILFSAAIPFQGGQNHLNEQWPDFWAKKFQEHGYSFYDGIRNLIWDNSKVNWWYKQNIFLVSKHKLHPPFYLSHRAQVHPTPYYRNSAELDRILNGKIGLRYMLSILFKFVSHRIRRKFWFL